MAPSIMSVSILYVYVLLRILRDGAEADTGEAASIVAHLMPVSPRQPDTASTDSTPMPLTKILVYVACILRYLFA